jgi:hypothetical protein
VDPVSTPARGPALVERTEVIRPAAVLPDRAAVKVLEHLRWADVGKGGLWNASASMWQRYDKPWDGIGGTRGSSQLVGSIGVMYDTPARFHVTIYRVTITVAGQQQGWDVASLCDDALTAARLTLAECPVTTLPGAPLLDPFKETRRS